MDHFFFELIKINITVSSLQIVHDWNCKITQTKLFQVTLYLYQVCKKELASNSVMNLKLT